MSDIEIQALILFRQLTLEEKQEFMRRVLSQSSPSQKELPSDDQESDLGTNA